MGFYWLAKHAEKSKTETNNGMSRGYNFAKGVITDIHYYKGRTLQVKYQISGVNYICSQGWDRNPRHLDEGDSVKLKYAIENPKLIITELENAYYDTP